MAFYSTYAAASRYLENNSLRYRSVKFECKDADVKDVDIVRALMVQCDVDDIERVHPMPGNYWVVVFSTPELAEEATNGFILRETKIYPNLIAQRFITATVAFAPAIASLGDIERALEPFAEVISIKDLYIREFPAIKNGKQRVVLKPRGAGLPSFFQVGRYKASLFFTGRVSCCPYCEETTHLGRDCTTKHVKRCFTCGQRGHISRNCPGDPRPQPQQDNRRATDNNEQERRDSNKINGEQAAESDSTPSVSVDMADVEKLSDTESSDSSADTLVEVPEQSTTSAAATTPTTPQEPKDEINIVKVNDETEQVLEGLFESPERPTRAEQDQDRQETQDHTQELFTDPDEEEKMETMQNNKRKPVARVDLRTKFGQSSKPRRSPKHKKRKDKL